METSQDTAQRHGTAVIVRPLLRLVLALVCLLPACAPVVVDSELTPEQAIRANQPPGTPEDVLRRLTVVNVRYYGFDHRLHQGQIVVLQAVAGDIRQVFAVIRDSRFPVESVLPVAHPLNQLKGPFGLSPDTGNTSAFAWRPRVGENDVSLHGLGLAVDINPRLNPYRKGTVLLPPGASYDPSRPGTLTSDCPVVRAFRLLGWEWGGDWANQGKIDYMHFQKIPGELEQWVKEHREQP